MACCSTKLNAPENYYLFFLIFRIAIRKRLKLLSYRVEWDYCQNKQASVNKHKTFANKKETMNEN